MGIRSTCKAIIIDNNKILLNKCYDENNGHYYSLPGGGQHKFETLEEAVIRECLEETGYNVIPIRFAALFEEICINTELPKEYDEYLHKMYHIFICKLNNMDKVEITEKDSMQLYSEWIDINSLNNIRILPEPLEKEIYNIINDSSPKFIGSSKIMYGHG